MLKMAKKVWIFDLDNTLHNASAEVFPVMNQAMTQYIMHALDLNEADAHFLRRHYWQVYGATLKGLMRHHGVNPHHFLSETHDSLDLETMVSGVKKLKHTLDKIKARKCVFTNGPKKYAMRILRIMGIADCFECVFSVESTQFHAKPNVRGFAMLLKKLKVKPSDCVMVEDSWQALMTAKRLGMTTILVVESLKKPIYVDYRINSVLALTHIRL